MAEGGGAVKTAVITGGAGGLGRALGAALRARGWHVAAIDLPGPPLDALAAESGEISTHACDLTDAEAIRRTAAAIRTARPSIDLVVYNAGVTLIAPFADIAMPAHRRLFDINYFAATDVAAEFLEDVRASRGTHLAISSVAGFAPLHHRTAYAASKHALEGFFNSLRSEEAQFGVTVQVAAPSFVATNLDDPGTDAQGISRPGAAADGVDYMTPEAAAAIIMRGLDAGKPMIPVGRVARLAWVIQRLSPRLMAALMRRQMRR